MTPAVPCYMKTHGFRPSLSRPHPDPQSGRPAMSNSRQSRLLPSWKHLRASVFWSFQRERQASPVVLLRGRERMERTDWEEA